MVPENVDEVRDGEHAWVMEENMHELYRTPHCGADVNSTSLTVA